MLKAAAIQIFIMGFSLLDWFVLIVTLLTIILYGIYKGKSTKNLDGYFLGNRQLRPSIQDLK